MKLIVQIPCFNEEKNLVQTLRDIPTQIEGIDTIELLIVDDGSQDQTIRTAREFGVDHIVRHTTNKGLARTFRTGIDTALKLGADIIVNTDGDNQYCGADIALLVQPVLQGEADIAVGDRGGFNNMHFSRFKRVLQVFGSSVIRRITRSGINDAVSGMRAISREAAKQINIITDFSYTIEMLIQASAKRLKVVSVPVRTNAKTRESRLFKSIPQFLYMSGATLVRSYAMYKPLRVFTLLGAAMLLIGLLPIGRFLFFYFSGDGNGHLQSIVLGASFVVMGIFTLLIGMVADLINFNRKLLELSLLKLTDIELEVMKKSEKNSHFDADKIRDELDEMKIQLRKAS